MGAVSGDANTLSMWCVDDNDLASRPIAGLKDGDRAYVVSHEGTSEGPLFFLSRSSSTPVDGVGVLATPGGVGRWLSEALYGGSGRGLSVTDVAALGLLTDDGMADGTTVFVESLRAMWSLRRMAPIAADGITLVEASSATGMWYRELSPHPSWATRVSWEIDPVGGDDEASGEIGAPIKTFAELRRRLLGQHLLATVLITVYAAVPANDPINFTGFTVGPNVDINVRGNRTSAAGGTIAAVTPINRAGNQLMQIQSLDVAGGWAANLRRMVRITTIGVRFGAVAYAIADLGGGNVVVSPFARTDTAQGTPVLIVPVIGDTFEFIDLLEVGAWPTVDLGSGGQFVARTSFTNLSFPALTQFDTGIRSTLVKFNDCVLGSAYATGSCNFYAQNCRIGRGFVGESAQLVLRAGFIDSSMAVSTPGLIQASGNAWLLLEMDFVLGPGSGVQVGTATPKAGSFMTLSSTGIYSAGYNAGVSARVFDLGAHASVNVIGVAYGTSNNAIGFRLRARSVVTYVAGSSPVFGTGAAVNIDYGGGVTQTFAAMAAAVNTAQANGAAWYFDQ